LFNQTVANAPPNLRPIGWANAAEIIPAADIFLSTSLNEGIPYSLLEVQSFGIPIVAVNSGAISELVQNGINGILCDVDAVELARAVEKLTINSGQRMEFSREARKSVVDREGLSEMVPAHLRLYRNLLKTGL
jgi:glycosyltransferase involved in cell wall biosynthesis